MSDFSHKSAGTTGLARAVGLVRRHYQQSIVAVRTVETLDTSCNLYITLTALDTQNDVHHHCGHCLTQGSMGTN